MRRVVATTVGIIVFLSCVLTTSAQGAFPGANGKIAFTAQISGGPHVNSINPDGTADTDLTPGPCCNAFDEPAWSPGGARLALRQQYQGVLTMNGDGSGKTSLGSPEGTEPAWSPDGQRIAYTIPERTDQFDPSISYPAELWVMNADGTAKTQLVGDGSCAGPLETDGPCTAILSPTWSPDGTRIAFLRTDAYLDYEEENGCFVCHTPREVWFADPDAPGSAVKLQGGPQGRMHVDWHPSGARLLVSGDGGLVSMNVDGSGQTSLGAGRQAAWSPDGARIVYQTAASSASSDVFTKNADGTNPALVRAGGSNPDWQPVPVTPYPRPKGASPVWASIVPAYAQCTAPIGTHGSPLAAGSCSPPATVSDELTLGTPDANGRPVKGSSLVRYSAVAGNPATVADEADVRITVAVHNVYDQQTLADYTGELRVRSSLRMTDKLNNPGINATVSDMTLGATVSCTATPDTTQGATCSLATSADALAPGTLTEGKRAVWELGQVQIDDGGADGDAETPADNTLFMVQGVFVP